MVRQTLSMTLNIQSSCICEQSVWNFLFFAVLSSVSLILRCSMLNLIIMCHFQKLKTPSVTVTYETIIFLCSVLYHKIYPWMTEMMDMIVSPKRKNRFRWIKNIFLINLTLPWQQHSCPHAKLLLSIHHHFNIHKIVTPLNSNFKILYAHNELYKGLSELRVNDAVCVCECTYSAITSFPVY